MSFDKGICLCDLSHSTDHFLPSKRFLAPFLQSIPTWPELPLICFLSLWVLSSIFWNFRYMELHRCVLLHLASFAHRNAFETCLWFYINLFLPIAVLYTIVRLCHTLFIYSYGWRLLPFAVWGYNEKVAMNIFAHLSLWTHAFYFSWKQNCWVIW